MTVFVDPDHSAPLLRQSVYHGNVVVLTSLPSVREFVDYTRDPIGRRLQTLRSGVCARAHRRDGDGKGGGFVEAPLHPLADVEGSSLQHHPGGRV